MCESKLSRLKRVQLNEIWQHEALDFTPWLEQAENMTLPGDILGLCVLSISII